MNGSGLTTAAPIGGAKSSTVRRILERTDRLPTLSNSVSRLNAVIQDVRSSAEDVEQVIRPDATLTANLLRMANSAFFGIPRQIETARQAITVLGMRRVYEAAVSASFVRIIPKYLPGYEIESRVFWQHCVAVAVLGERLAAVCHQRAPELIFTAGLLHDIGKLAIGDFLVEQAPELRERLRSGECLYGAELELLGTTHAEIGGLVCEKWKLPENIGRAVCWHHTPSSTPPGAERQLVDLVHVANGLAHLIGQGEDVGGLARDLDATALARMGLKVRQAEAVAAEAADHIRQLGEVFDAPTGGK